MVNLHCLSCWCGNDQLLPFSEDYQLCNNCHTLVLSQPINKGAIIGSDDDGLYGKSYWFEHQENDLGFGNIISRARTDIPERLLNWLRTILKYKIPPGQTLEIGCSHGGFVFALQMAGFHASGLELSPWVVEFAQQTFQVPVLLGEVETQRIAPSTLDAIILMDVLEHLPNPLSTISHCLELLKPDGILLIQTPQYKEGKGYQEMLLEKSPFLQMLQAPEHIYLFSKSSIEKFFNQLGICNLSFEEAFFSHTDMLLITSKSELVLHPVKFIEQSIIKTPNSRLILALLDLESKRKELQNHLQEIEADRTERLGVIQDLGHQLGGIEGERNDLRNQLRDILEKFESMELDRAVRLTVIEQQAHEMIELNMDRAARLEIIERQAGEIEQQSREIEHRTRESEKQVREIRELREELYEARSKFVNFDVIRTAISRIARHFRPK